MFGSSNLLYSHSAMGAIIVINITHLVVLKCSCIHMCWYTYVQNVCNGYVQNVGKKLKKCLWRGGGVCGGVCVDFSSIHTNTVQPIDVPFGLNPANRRAKMVSVRCVVLRKLLTYKTLSGI